ncbi:MAG: hypothetical protein Q9219_005203 [cf. Caloplaca sp. 3 TL-2023]
MIDARYRTKETKANPYHGVPFLHEITPSVFYAAYVLMGSSFSEMIQSKAFLDGRVSGTVISVSLPKWKGAEEQEALIPREPTGKERNLRKWIAIKSLIKRMINSEKEKARGVALVTQPGVEGQIRLIIKGKILEDPRRYAWAGINIPPTATYREFAGFSLKELRRQNLHPTRIPTFILVEGISVNWRMNDKRGRSLPRRLNDNNFEGSLLVYFRGLRDHRVIEPAEMEILVKLPAGRTESQALLENVQFPSPAYPDEIEASTRLRKERPQTL